MIQVNSPPPTATLHSTVTLLNTQVCPKADSTEGDAHLKVQTGENQFKNSSTTTPFEDSLPSPTTLGIEQYFERSKRHSSEIKIGHASDKCARRRVILSNAVPGIWDSSPSTYVIGGPVSFSRKLFHHMSVRQRRASSDPSSDRPEPPRVFFPKKCSSELDSTILTTITELPKPEGIVMDNFLTETYASILYPKLPCLSNDLMSILNKNMYSIGAYILTLTQSTSIQQAILATTQFIAHFIDNSNKGIVACATTLKEWIASFMFEGKTYVHTFQSKKEKRVLPKPESFEDFINALRSIRSGTLSVAGYPIIRKLSSLLAILVNSSIGVSLGLTGIPTTRAFKRTAASAMEMEVPDIFLLVCDSVIDFLDGSYQYWIKGNENAFVHSGDTHQAWLKEAADLSVLYNHRVLGSIGQKVPDGKISRTAYNMRLSKAIAMGEEITLLTKGLAKPSLAALYLRTYTSLTQLRSHIFTTEEASASRFTPYATMLVSPPSVGKSNLMNYIMKVLHAVYHPDIPYSPELTYVKPNSTQFWDGLTNDVKYIIMDDLGCFTPEASQDSDLADFISTVNTVAFKPNMADLKDKGKIRVDPDAVLITANNSHLNTVYMFNTPSAVMRRVRVRVRLTPKPEYRQEGTEMLDSSKTPEPDQSSDYSDVDLWNIKVDIIKVGKSNKQGFSLPVFVPVLETDDIRVYFNWLIKSAKEHRLHCEKAKRAEDNFCNVQICEHDQVIFMCKLCKLKTKPAPPPPEKLSTRPPMPAEHPKAEGMPIIVATVTTENPQYVYNFVILAIQFLCAITLYKTYWGPGVEYYNRLVYNLAQFHRTATSLDLQVKRVGDMVERNLINLHVATHTLKKYLPAMKVFAGTAAAIASVQILKAYMQIPPQPEGNKFTTEDCNERVDVYRKQSVPYKQFFSNASRSSKMVDVIRLVKNNTFSMHVGSHVFVAFSIGGTQYLCSSHSLPKGRHRIIIAEGPSHSAVSPRKEFIYDDSTVWRDEVNDIASFTLPGSFLRRDLTEFIPQATKLALDLSFQASIVDPIEKVHKVQARTAVTQPYSGEKLNVAPSYDYSFKYDMRRNGMCGSPLIIDLEKGAALVGLHVCGLEKNNIGFSAPISREYLKRIKFSTSIPADILPGDLDLTAFAEGTPKLVPTLHHKNPANFVEGFGAVLGELEGKSIGRPTHSVEHTILKRYVDKIPALQPYIGKFCQPNMSIGTKYGIYNNPYQQGLSELVKSNVVFSPQDLELASSNYLSRVRAHVPEDVFFELVPLTDSQAINGIPGKMYIDSINKNAGGGFSMPGPKSRYLIPDPSPDANKDDVQWKPEIVTHIKALEKHLDSGQTIEKPFMVYMKDEPAKVKPRKAEETETIRAFFKNMDDNRIVEVIGEEYNAVLNGPKLTRTFTGIDAAFGHIVRKYYLPIVSVIQTYNLAFECAVGVNAMDGSWGAFRSYLTRFSESRCIAGDFGFYDKFITSGILLQAFSILIALLSSPAFLLINLKMWAIAMSSSNPIMVYQYLVIKVLNGMPSGHTLTVILNSIVNSLLHRLAWMKSGFQLSDFNLCVNLLTYGDDSASNIAKNCKFNQTHIHKVFTDYGIKYTRADKSEVTGAFDSITEIDFLKRGFVEVTIWDKKVILAPLSLASIYKMLCFRFNCSLTSISHAEANIYTAQRELWQHGEEVYDSIVPYLEATAESIPGLKPAFYTYEQMTEIMKPAYEMNSIVPFRHGVSCAMWMMVLNANHNTVTYSWKYRLLLVLGALVEEYIKYCYGYHLGLYIGVLESMVKAHMYFNPILHAFMYVLARKHPALSLIFHVYVNASQHFSVATIDFEGDLFFGMHFAPINAMLGPAIHVALAAMIAGFAATHVVLTGMLYDYGVTQDSSFALPILFSFVMQCIYVIGGISVAFQRKIVVNGEEFIMQPPLVQEEHEFMQERHED